MDNNIEPLLIGQRDFDCIGQVAHHCDWQQLCIYIREQQNLSLLPKIGPCLFDKLVAYDLGYCTSGGYDGENVLRHLWHGGRYTGCDGTPRVHFGLKRALIHWSYGAYVYRSSFVDTPFGMVQKMNQDSVPVDGPTLSSINKEQRSNAEDYYNMTMDYLCSVKDCDPISECHVCDCVSGCGCGHCSGQGSTLQRRSFRFRNITKFDNVDKNRDRR